MATSYESITYEDLLPEIAPDKPSGIDLLGDEEYMTLKRDSKGTEARVLPKANPRGSDEAISKRFIPEVEPQWQVIHDTAVALLKKRSHDLSVMAWYTVALLKLHGFAGLADGLGAIRFALQERWSTIYPAVDDKADFPPHRRRRILSDLFAPIHIKVSDGYRLLVRVRETPIVRAANIGEFSILSLLRANGKQPVPEGYDKPSMEQIAAAWAEADLGELQGTLKAIESARDELAQIQSLFKSKSAQSDSANIDFNELDTLLVQAVRHVDDTVRDRIGLSTAAPSPAETALSHPALSGVSGTGAAGPIRTRRDVQRCLESVLKFYEDPEQERMSSPVTVFVKAALCMLGQNFSDSQRVLGQDDLNKVIKTMITKVTDQKEESSSAKA